MKKFLILLLFTSLICGNVESKDIKGIIIYLNDTVEVTFKIPINPRFGTVEYTNLISKVKYYNSEGKKVKLSPDDVLEFRFSYKNEEIRMVSVHDDHAFGDNFSKANNIFLKLVVDGKIRLFEYYFSDSNLSGQSYIADSYLLKRKNSKLWWPEQFAFRKDMLNYLHDCPVLTQKIQEKELVKKDLKEIVIFYNKNCGK